MGEEIPAHHVARWLQSKNNQPPLITRGLIGLVVVATIIGMLWIFSASAWQAFDLWVSS
ncbi:hypothetical protein [Microbacterium sp. B35-04]|uniref:hypothetical protein n=1 Tax=Microbacterium sp. B35-04 TaxID=1961716 RepID=UPI0013CF5F22|nr:hypothetical protein [Microbacterium sp. B35-04]